MTMLKAPSRCAFGGLHEAKAKEPEKEVVEKMDDSIKDIQSAVGWGPVFCTSTRSPTEPG